MSLQQGGGGGGFGGMSGFGSQSSFGQTSNSSSSSAAEKIIHITSLAQFQQTLKNAGSKLVVVDYFTT